MKKLLILLTAAATFTCSAEDVTSEKIISDDIVQESPVPVLAESTEEGVDSAVVVDAILDSTALDSTLADSSGVDSVVVDSTTIDSSSSDTLAVESVSDAVDSSALTPVASTAVTTAAVVENESTPETNKTEPVEEKVVETEKAEAVEEKVVEVEKAEAVEEKVEATEKETVKEPKQKKEKSKEPTKPFFSIAAQFYNSSYGTNTLALNLEAGINVHKKHLHSVEGYFPLFRSETNTYSVENVWGLNYNYLWLNDFGTKFLRIDLGFKAGYNIYEEKNKLLETSYKTVTFGGPRGQLNLNLGKIGIGGGYTMFLGYREMNNDQNLRESTKIDQWNITFGVRI